MSTPAYRTVAVSITAQDIENGLRGGCFRCPGALAINRFLKEGLGSVVGYDLVNLVNLVTIDKSAPVVFDVPAPEALTRFIVTFDDGRDVEPVTFDLTLPESVLA